MSSLSGSAVASKLLVGEMEFVKSNAQIAAGAGAGVVVKASALPSGLGQPAGVAAGELWVDSASGNVIKVGV